MKINIKATNIELSDALRSYVDEKVEMLEKILPPRHSDDEAMVDVEIGRETQHHRNGEIFKAEINLKYSAGQHYVVARESDLYAAIDVAKDDMVRTINSKIEKKNTLLRRGGRRIKEMLRRIRPWRD